LVKFQDWFLEKNVEFVTWQREKGAEGTPHLQGYFVTKKNEKSKNGFTMKWIKENLNKNMHVEKREGTHEQAIAYCNKKDTRVKGPWTLGTHVTESENRKAVGERRKVQIADILNDVKAGATENDLWEKYPNHMLHYGKAVKGYSMLKKLGTRQQPKIIVLYGPPGTGKSHKATEIAKTVGPAYRWQSSPSGSVWFDGYDPMNHKVVIFDDFKGGMPYTMLLRLLDRYPMHVEGKGFCVPFNPEWIIITSNHPPNEWYFQGAEKDFRGVEKTIDCSALLRRVNAPYGKTVKMEDKFEEPAPVFDIEEEWTKANKMIDLTVSDNEDNPPPSAEYEETDENEFLEDGYRDFEDFEDEVDYDDEINDETEFPTTSQYDEEEPPKNKLKRTLSLHKTPEAELEVVKPLSTAGHFKKVGAGPVQSLLRLKRARDEDEDIDDK